MNIINLLISDTAPLFPALRGGQKRIWHLYSDLGDRFDITYVGMDCGLCKRYVDRRIKSNFREIIQPVTKAYYPFRYLDLKVLKNEVFDIFIHVCMVLDKGFKKEINRHKADVLIASHPWSSPCFRIKDGQAFIYDAHNCEYTLAQDILKGRWYKAIVCFLVKLIESAACKKAVKIIVSSKKDKELFVKLYKISGEKISVVPNGACIRPSPSYERKKDVRLKLKIESTRPVLLFIGTNYKPNIDAAKFIVNEIAPKIEEADIVILGSAGECLRGRALPGNVRLTGALDDAGLYDWLMAADIGLNPVSIGSGISMKMLDYFAFSLPVVTTQIGARGIAGMNLKDFIVCEPCEFADKIKYLLSNPGLREDVGRNARKLAEEAYDWKKISSSLNIVLNSVLK